MLGNLILADQLRFYFRRNFFPFQKVVDLIVGYTQGMLIFFSGIVTFKNAAALKEVAKQVPLDRILVETDSPYLAPIPHRGKTNQPAYVKYVAEEIARLRDISLEEVTAATTENFFRLFKHATP